jgi:hypothetical protein
MRRKPIPDRITTFLAKKRYQRFLAVSAQVVHHQMNRLRLGISLLDLRQHLGKLRTFAILGDRGQMFACLWFNDRE